MFEIDVITNSQFPEGLSALNRGRWHPSAECEARGGLRFCSNVFSN